MISLDSPAERVRSSEKRTAAPLCQKEPAEVVQASDVDVSWLSPRGDIQGTSNMSVSELTCVFVFMCALTHLSVKGVLQANANLKLRIKTDEKTLFSPPHLHL